MSPEQLVGTIEQVETHSDDPKAEYAADPWDEVTNELGSLGNRLRDTYRKVADERGPSEEEIKDAFSTLLNAWDQVSESVSTALNDPETREHLKQAASSFASALGNTMSGIGDEIRKSTRDRSVVPDVPGDETVDEGGSGGSVVDGDGEEPPVTEGEL